MHIIILNIVTGFSLSVLNVYCGSLKISPPRLVGESMMDKGIKHTWDSSQDCIMATWNSEASEGPQRSMLGRDREWASSVCSVSPLKDGGCQHPLHTNCLNGRNKGVECLYCVCKVGLGGCTKARGALEQWGCK